MLHNEMANAIWANLANGAVIKGYPKGEIDHFYNSYIEQNNQTYKAYYSTMFSSFEEFMTAYYGSTWASQLKAQSETDVKQNLIFHAIAQNEGIIITDTDYQNALQYYVDYYTSQGQTVTAKKIEEQLGERMIKEQALFDKVNELIATSSTPTFE
jgi:FKBP-type peptidyl-prolyl cis-trans isomerase (trigger factor)